MPTALHLLDVVALLADVPAHGLVRGQVGTVVELLNGAAKSNSQMTKERPTRKWFSRPISYSSFTTIGAERSCVRRDDVSFDRSSIPTSAPERGPTSTAVR